MPFGLLMYSLACSHLCVCVRSFSLSFLPSCWAAFFHAFMHSFIDLTSPICLLVGYSVGVLPDFILISSYLPLLGRRSWRSQLNSFPPVVNRDVASTRPFLGCKLLPIQSCCRIAISKHQGAGLGTAGGWISFQLTCQCFSYLSILTHMSQFSSCKISKFSLQNDPLSPCLPLWRRSWWSWAARVVQQLLNYLQVKGQQGGRPGRGNLDPLRVVAKNGLTKKRCFHDSCQTFVGKQVVDPIDGPV